jgi:hypothetical protein
MKANFSTARIARRRVNLISFAPKAAVAIPLLGCLIAGAFTAATSTADAARSERAEAQSVNRTVKGDRLPLPAKFAAATPSSLVTNMRRPPVGCDPAFSRAADPARAHVFGRCLS